MASKSFALNEEPHVASFGKTDLLFVPEATGPEFAEAYDRLRDVQIKAKNAEGMGKALSGKNGKSAQSDGMSKELLIELSDSMREFIAAFLLDDEQRKVFGNLRLPNRLLTEIMEWVAELYGGGSGNGDDGGQSSD